MAMLIAWLLSGRILTAIWLHSGGSLTSPWLHSCCILLCFNMAVLVAWLHSGCILPAICILAAVWLRLLAAFRLHSEVF